MRRHGAWRHLGAALAAAWLPFGTGAVPAQSSTERVHNVAAGISIVPPPGWHQLVPRPGAAATQSPSGSAAERQAFLEQLADRPVAMLFLFAKDLQFRVFGATANVEYSAGRFAAAFLQINADNTTVVSDDTFLKVALHEIGHLHGLGDVYDAPSRGMTVMMNAFSLDDPGNWIATAVTSCDKWAAWQNARGF